MLGGEHSPPRVRGGPHVALDLHSGRGGPGPFRRAPLLLPLPVSTAAWLTHSSQQPAQAQRGAGGWVQRTGSGGRPWEEVVSSQRHFTSFLLHRCLRRRRFSREKQFLGFTHTLSTLITLPPQEKVVLFIIVNVHRNHNECPIGTTLRVGLE
jgi:hypothetical protein